MIFLIALLTFLPYVFCHPKVMEFKWKSAGEGYKYKIQISRDENFYDLFTEEITTKTNFMMDLPPGKYFFRIIPLWKNFEGEPSMKINFEIKITDSSLRENLSYIYPPEVQENIHFTNAEILKLKVVSSNNTVKGITYSLDSPKDFKFARSNLVLRTENLSEGEHKIYYRSISPSGKESKLKEYSFILDKTPPQIEFFAKTFNFGTREYIRRKSIIEINIYDDSPFDFYIWMNGKRIFTNSFIIPDDADKIRVTVFARDSFENINTLTKTFFVDRNPPSIKIKDSKIKTDFIFLQDKKLTINFSDDTKVKEYYLKINENTYPVDFFDLKGLKSGSYNLVIFASDIFENTNILFYNLIISNEKEFFEAMLNEIRK